MCDAISDESGMMELDLRELMDESLSTRGGKEEQTRFSEEVVGKSEG